MKTKLLITTFLLLLAAPASAQQLSCSQVSGASIFGYDYGEWVFIGAIANPFSSQSIANEYGDGSKYKSASINNEYGRYGSAYSSYSAFSDYASKPPIVVDSNFNLLGYITTSYKTPAINPYAAIRCAENSFSSADRSMKDVVFSDREVQNALPNSAYGGNLSFEEYEELLKDDDSYKNIKNGFIFEDSVFCEEGYVQDGNECEEPASEHDLNEGSNSLSDPANNPRLRFENAMKRGRYASIEDLTKSELESYEDIILENVPSEKIREFAPKWFVEKNLVEKQIETTTDQDALLKQINDLLSLIALLQEQIAAKNR